MAVKTEGIMREVETWHQWGRVRILEEYPGGVSGKKGGSQRRHPSILEMLVPRDDCLEQQPLCSGANLSLGYIL